MKYCMVFILLVFAVTVTAQKSKSKKQSIGLGIKGGYNYANVTNITSVNGNNRSGFHLGILYAPGGGNFGGSGELIFSRQGYNFKTATNTGKVNLDYLLFPTLTNFTFGKFLKLQLGLQTAYLLNAKADSSKPAAASNPYNKIIEYYNRFEFSLAGGVELNPVSGFIIGARYTIGLTDANKQQPATGPTPPFLPSISGSNLKNNIIQLFAGYKF